jgi:hypothetical protein
VRRFTATHDIYLTLQLHYTSIISGILTKPNIFSDIYRYSAITINIRPFAQFILRLEILLIYILAYSLSVYYLTLSFCVQRPPVFVI